MSGSGATPPVYRREGEKYPVPPPTTAKNAGAQPTPQGAEASATVPIPPVRWGIPSPPVPSQRSGAVQPQRPEAPIPPVRMPHASGVVQQRKSGAAPHGTPSNAIPPVRMAGTTPPAQPQMAGAATPQRTAVQIPPVRMPGATAFVQLQQPRRGGVPPVTTTGQRNHLKTDIDTHNANHGGTGDAPGEKVRLHFLSTQAKLPVLATPVNASQQAPPPARYWPQPMPQVLQTMIPYNRKSEAGAAPYTHPVQASMVDSPGSRSAKRPPSPSPSVPFSVPPVMSRFGGSLQCMWNPRRQIATVRESLIQVAKDLGMLAETVNYELGRSPESVDTQALSRGLKVARDLGLEAQNAIRYDEDLDPRLPQAYKWLLALYEDHKRALKQYRQSDDYLDQLIAASNRQSRASNPLGRFMEDF